MSPQVPLENHILQIRGIRVMLDSDLATLYEVTTGNLVKAVKRNADRFPEDFMFALTRDEFENLLFQTGRARTHGGRRTPPLAFTEHGVAMLSSVLRSERAISVNIAIMRAFARLRRMVLEMKDMTTKLSALERKMIEHDENFAIVFKAINELMAEPPEEERPKRRIGFHPDGS